MDFGRWLLAGFWVVSEVDKSPPMKQSAGWDFCRDLQADRLATSRKPSSHPPRLSEHWRWTPWAWRARRCFT